MYLESLLGFFVTFAPQHPVLTPLIRRGEMCMYPLEMKIGQEAVEEGKRSVQLIAIPIIA